MALINPFSFTPIGPFDRMNAYFYTTWIRIQYANWIDGDEAIQDLVGATGWIDIEEELPLLPRVNVLTCPSGKIVLIRGSTSNIQVLQEVNNSGTVAVEPWPGTISRFFRDSAREVSLRVSGSVEGDWIAAGHSLGGAIAGLISIHGATKVFTAGQPREGDGAYAIARPSPSKLRLTNQNDPTPHIPLSSGTALDFLAIPLPAPVAQTYRHWGIRKHLWQDGTVTMPGEETSGLDGNLLDELARSPFSGIFDNHYQNEYARRVRSGIPVEFPAEFPDVDFPGLYELDQLNLQLNADDGITNWQGSSGLILPPSLPVFLPPTGRCE